MTSAIRWEPIEDIKAIRDLVSQSLGWLQGRVPLPGLCATHLAVDLYETGEAYVAVVDMPGVESEDLDLSVSRGKLIIAGKRKPADPEPAYVRRERLATRFSRSLRLPDDVDMEQIGAKFSGGVLTITLPKSGGAEAEAEG